MIMLSPLKLHTKQYSPLLDKIFSKAVKNFPLAAADIAKYIYTAGGKRLRPACLLLVSSALGASMQRALGLAAGVELLHCATLLHDDIEDRAGLRRGKKAAHLIYGLRGAILTGDAMLAAAYNLTAKHGNSRIMGIFSQALINTLQGQMLELTGTCNMEEYLASITQKTGSLFAASCQMGAILAKAPKQVVDAAWDMGCNFGIAYQLIDDAMDFLPPGRTGKKQGADLAAGNLTLPLRFYADTMETGERENFIQALREKSFNANERGKIVTAVLNSGLSAKVLDFAQQYLARAQKSLLFFPDCLEKNTLFNLLSGTELRAMAKNRV